MCATKNSNKRGRGLYESLSSGSFSNTIKSLPVGRNTWIKLLHLRHTSLCSVHWCDAVIQTVFAHLIIDRERESLLFASTLVFVFVGNWTKKNKDDKRRGTSVPHGCVAQRTFVLHCGSSSFGYVVSNKKYLSSME